MERRLYRVVGGVLVLTALVLFLIVPALAKSVSSQYALGFADDYDVLAKSLAAGQGYRLRPEMSETMMREPGYPLVLAGVFMLLGSSIEAARLANLLLAGATALLLWHLARRVVRDDAAALLAAGIFLLHPGTLVAQARGGVEILFMFTMVGFLLLLQRAIEADKARHYILAGLALGALVLVRSTPLVFPIVLVAYLVFTAPAQARGRRFAFGVLLTFAMVLVMSPWIARNYALSGAFVPTASVQGVALQEGQYTCERLSFGRDFQALQSKAGKERDRLAGQAGLRFKGSYYQYFYDVADELAFNRMLLRQAFQRYHEDPALLARCSAANLLHFWFLGKNGIATAANVVVQLPLLALALAGLFILWRRGGAAWMPSALFAACIVALHLPIIAHARHSVPLVPLLAIFAATALVAAWRRRGQLLPKPAPHCPA